MSRYTLIESKPHGPAGISCRYFLVPPEQAGRRTILVVAFEGEYPEGSRGNGHGAYIASEALHGVCAFDADCLLLDFRALEYRWGNSLLRVFQDVSQFKDGELEPGEPAFPVVVITSEKCKHAFLSLITPTGQSAPEWHFEEIDPAIEYAQRKIEEWFSF